MARKKKEETSLVFPTEVPDKLTFSEKEQNLSLDTQEIVDKIISETDPNAVKDLTQLFNMNLSKKSLVRLLKLNDLYDKVNDQAIERFEKRPDEISNKDLLDYMQVLQNSIEKAQRNLQGIGEQPTIQITQNTNTVNIGNDATKITKESKDRVFDFVRKVIEASNSNEVKDFIDHPQVDLDGEEDDK